MKKLKKFHIIIILFLASSYNAIYSLAFMKSLYYKLMQNGLSLTHFKLGQLYSIYGLFSMFSYLCGAFFLSRFSNRRLVTGSLLSVGLLTLVLSLLPSYKIMVIIFGIIGFILGAVFYPSHLQILHKIGGDFNQGTVFSLFYMFNCILGIFFTSLGFKLTSAPFSDVRLVKSLFILFAALNVISAVLAFLFLKNFDDEPGKPQPVSIQTIKHLCTNKKLWLVIIIVFTNYICFSGLNYILPFLNDTYAIPAGITKIITIVRTYLIGIIAAPIAGKITDALHFASRLVKYSFLFTIITIVTFLLFFRTNFVGTLICMFLLCFFVNMGKSMSLVTLSEARVGAVYYGLSISFLSFCAYSPDAFYYSISGFILDCFPSSFGYYLIFFVIALFSVIGYICSMLLSKK